MIFFLRGGGQLEFQVDHSFITLNIDVIQLNKP